MNCLKHFSRLFVIALAAVLFVSGAEPQPLLLWDTWTDHYESEALCVSPDGTVVGGSAKVQARGPDPTIGVGWLVRPPGAHLHLPNWMGTNGVGVYGVTNAALGVGRDDTHALLWDPATRKTSAIVNFPAVPPWRDVYEAAEAVSHNGDVIVGWKQLIGTIRIWNGSVGFYDLSYPVVGFMWNRRTNAYKVVAPSMVHDGSGREFAVVLTDVTADGSKAVGRVEWALTPDTYTSSAITVTWSNDYPTPYNWIGNYVEWHWHGSERYRFLYLTYPTAISDDGRTVVGYAAEYPGASRVQAWRWREGVGFQALDPDAYTAGANSCTKDGNTVVGFYQYSVRLPMHAVIWNADGSRVDLNDLARSMLGDGSVLEVATDITPGGRIIVGWGYHAPTRGRRAFWFRRW